jgi:hypothetical protein
MWIKAMINHVKNDEMRQIVKTILPFDLWRCESRVIGRVMRSGERGRFRWSSGTGPTERVLSILEACRDHSTV